MQTQTESIPHGFDGTKSNLPQAASALSVGPELPTNHSPLEQQWHPDLPHSTSLGLGFAQHFAAIEYARSAGRHNDTVVQSGQGKATNIWDAPRQPLPYVSSHVAPICEEWQKKMLGMQEKWHCVSARCTFLFPKLVHLVCVSVPLAVNMRCRNVFC